MRSPNKLLLLFFLLIGYNFTFAAIPTETKIYFPPSESFDAKLVLTYQIAQQCSVTVFLYDRLGQNIAALVNELKQPGEYSIEFDGSTVPEGNYFAVFNAGSVLTTLRMKKESSHALMDTTFHPDYDVAFASSLLAKYFDLDSNRTNKYFAITDNKIGVSEISTETRLYFSPQVYPDHFGYEFTSPLYREEHAMMGMSDENTILLGANGMPDPGAIACTWDNGAEHVYGNDTTNIGYYENQVRNYRKGFDRVVYGIFAEGKGFTISPLKGWEFISDRDYPLTFKVVKGVGYVYLCGKGTVKSPNGKSEALGQFDTPDKLILQANQSSPFIREGAIQAMGWVRDSSFFHPLVSALDDSNALVVRSAIESLGKLRDARALPKLEPFIHSNGKWIAETAAWAILEIKKERSVSE